MHRADKNEEKYVVSVTDRITREFVGWKYGSWVVVEDSELGCCGRF